MRTIASIRVALFALSVAVVACAVPASASAASAHAFKETFGSAVQPSFNEPEGMAVDQPSGDLFVIDAGAMGALA
jgi:hypothetical protein